MHIFEDYLRTAQKLSWAAPKKQHIVIAAAFRGRTPVVWRTNTETLHAEDRVLTYLRPKHKADRLVVWRFNLADQAREPKPSCPCAECCHLIRNEVLTKIEYLSITGIVEVPPSELAPYNKRRVNAAKYLTI